MFKMKFTTENAAFAGGNGQAEMARILRELADKIAAGYGRDGYGIVRDINGNQVGTYGYTLTADEE